MIAGAEGAPMEQAESDKDWTKAERWAWERIAAGEVADFAAMHGALDPGGDKGWSANRTLTSGFLQAILFEKRWVDRIPRDGIRITGARWIDEITLPHAELKWPLCLERCRFEGPVDLTGLRIEGRLSLRGSSFLGTGAGTELSLNLELAAVRRADLSETSFSEGVAATGAVIDGSLDFSGAAVGGPVKLNIARVGQDLSMGGSETSPARFEKEIHLVDAFVGGTLWLSGVTARGDLRMNGLEVKKNLFMRAPDKDDEVLRQGGALFVGGIDLTTAVIHGYLQMVGATCEGQVTMDATQIGEDLSAGATRSQPTTFHGPLRISAGRIKGSVDFRGTRFTNRVDCPAARVDGSFDLSGAVFEKELNLPEAWIGRNLVGSSFDGASGGGDETDPSRVATDGSADTGGAAGEGAVSTSAAADGGAPAAQAPLSTPARFQGEVNLASVHVGGTVSFATAKFAEKVEFSSAEVGGNLNLCGAAFEKQLVMRDIRIGRHLFMRSFDGGDSVFGGEVDLCYSVIGGHLELGSATFKAALGMSRARVGEDLTGLRLTSAPTLFQGPVTLTATRVDGTMTFAGAVYEGTVDMGDMRIGRHLFIRAEGEIEAVRFKDKVNLNHAEVAGHVEFDGSTFDQELMMQGIQVGHTLRAIATAFGGALDVSAASVGGLLVLDGAKLNGLNLSATRIGGQLRLGTPGSAASWSDGGRLDLRDAAAGSLHDYAKADPDGGWTSSWPKPGALQLDGFTYDRLGGFGVEHAEEMIERPVAWYIHWLSLDEPYSPQPYEHLAAVLRQAGEPERANQILYAGRERARADARAPGAPVRWLSRLKRMLGYDTDFRLFRAPARWLGLSLLSWTIGYGIGFRFFRALYPAAVLTLIGVLVLGPGIVGDPGTAAHPGVQLQSWLDKIVYSFDQLLPLIKLNPRLADVRLPAGLETYFYVHRFFGYLLSGFIAAGVAGLTQRSKS